MKRLFLSLLAAAFFSEASFALTVSHLKGSPFKSYDTPTHIYVIGYGGKLGAQLFETGVGRARKLQEFFPDHQYVFIGPDVIDKHYSSLDDYDDYRRELAKLGLAIELLDQRWLLSSRLLEIIDRYTAIASLEIISHSAAHLGAGLDSIPKSHRYYSQKRFSYETPGIETIADNFLDDAYIFFHGCNSGYIQAPMMAKTLSIPTAGSLTYTNFENIYENDLWYFNDEGKFPTGLKKALTNKDSFTSPQRCRAGNCTRMKPEPYPYSGFWGRLDSGISHYKFFCGEAVANTACKRAMAFSLLPYVGKNSIKTFSTEASRKEVAKEFLCPDAHRIDAKQACFDAMEAGMNDPLAGQFVGMTRGKVPYCDFESCKVEISCTNEAGSCRTRLVQANEDRLVMFREFAAYFEGLNDIIPELN